MMKKLFLSHAKAQRRKGFPNPLIFAPLRLCVSLLLIFFSPAAARDLDVLLIVGAPGTEEYGKKFETQAQAWKAACTRGEVNVETLRGPESAAQLEKRLATSKPERALWLVLIGHGSFDGRAAKFNTEGPDFDAKQLATWLAPLKQEVAVIHTGSASGAFLRPLAGKGRIIITATKSPDEVFYARFGEFFAQAIGGEKEADFDQDGQISLLEAFRFASANAAQFYENEGRLATEHALLEDNGDGVGTRREVLEKPPADAKLDGERAAQLVLVLSEEEKRLTEAQRATRDRLEREIKVLNTKSAELGDEKYYPQLEKLLRELAAVYAAP
jgi:hypothetical protein